MMNDLSQFLLVLLLTPFFIKYIEQVNLNSVVHVTALIAVVYYDCSTIDMHATGFQLFFTMAVMTGWASINAFLLLVEVMHPGDGNCHYATAAALWSYLMATRVLMVIF